MRHRTARTLFVLLATGGCTRPASVTPPASELAAQSCETVIVQLIPHLIAAVLPPGQGSTGRDVHADVQTFANAGSAFCGEPMRREVLLEAFGMSVRNARLQESELGNGGVHLMLESITPRGPDLEVIVWMSSRRPSGVAAGSIDTVRYLLTFQKNLSGNFEFVEKRVLLTT